MYSSIYSSNFAAQDSETFRAEPLLHEIGFHPIKNVSLLPYLISVAHKFTFVVDARWPKGSIAVRILEASDLPCQEQFDQWVRSRAGIKVKG